MYQLVSLYIHVHVTEEWPILFPHVYLYITYFANTYVYYVFHYYIYHVYYYIILPPLIILF